MRVRTRPAVATAFACALVAATAPHAGASGTCGLGRVHHLPAGKTYPSRDYYEHVPKRLPSPGRRALVVFLHGTTQTAANAACGVRWNELADRYHFVVAYPEQSTTDYESGGNGTRYWSWGQAAIEGHDSGEVRTIAEITRAVMEEQRVDPARVYITGISAGGIMASVMAASYPQLYSALAVVAGCSYLCSDATGDLTHARMTEGGRKARVVPTVLFQGSTDYLVNDGLGEMAVAGWVGANDLADDGQANGSVSRTPSSTENHRLDPYSLEPNPYAADHDAYDVSRSCLHVDPPKGNNPCPGEALGWSSYPYTIRRFDQTATGRTMVESWVIHGISHNYSGGSADPDATYVDPIGPDITTAAWLFFDQTARAIRP